MANTASILGKAVSRSVMTAKPPSRLPPAFCPSDTILMPGYLANTFLAPPTRSMTAETGGPLTITTLPLPLSRSAMYCPPCSPAWKLLEVMVASTPPSAFTSSATTMIPAALAFFTTGPTPWVSAAPRMMMSTPEAMKFSIWPTWVFRS